MNNLLYRYLVRSSSYKRKLLLLVFHFDKWHTSPLISRKYAQDLIKYLNGIDNKENYLEIGCGLGDIIKNVSFKKRLGLDYENEVLQAARFLSMLSFQWNIIYKKFTFPNDPIEGKFDVIVLVNWIHNIEPEILKSKLTDYFQNNLCINGIIIIDTVRNDGYKYNHKIDFLMENIHCVINQIGKYENNREIWAIIKK